MEENAEYGLGSAARAWVESSVTLAQRGDSRPSGYHTSLYDAETPLVGGDDEASNSSSSSSVRLRHVAGLGTRTVILNVADSSSSSEDITEIPSMSQRLVGAVLYSVRMVKVFRSRLVGYYDNYVTQQEALARKETEDRHLTPEERAMHNEVSNRQRHSLVFKARHYGTHRYALLLYVTLLLWYLCQDFMWGRDHRLPVTTAGTSTSVMEEGQIPDNRVLNTFVNPLQCASVLSLLQHNTEHDDRDLGNALEETDTVPPFSNSSEVWKRMMAMTTKHPTKNDLQQQQQQHSSANANTSPWLLSDGLALGQLTHIMHQMLYRTECLPACPVAFLNNSTLGPEAMHEGMVVCPCTTAQHAGAPWALLALAHKTDILLARVDIKHQSQRTQAVPVWDPQRHQYVQRAFPVGMSFLYDQWEWEGEGEGGGRGQVSVRRLRGQVDTPHQVACVMTVLNTLWSTH